MATSLNTPLTRKHLIVQTAFLGDLLLAIPLIRNLKKIYSKDQVYLVCRKGLGGMMKSLGIVDQVFEIEKGRRSSYQEVTDQLKDIKFEAIWVPHQSVRTALFVSKLKSNNKISFKKWWNFLFFNKRVERLDSYPDAIRQIGLLGAEHPSIIENIRAYSADLFYKVDDQNKLSEVPSWASMVFGKELSEEFNVPEFRDYIAVFPGSVWPTKRWTEKGFVELVKELQKSHQVHLMGGPGEESLCERICEKVPGVKNYSGKFSVFDSIRSLLGAKLVITNDSGSMHMASVAGVPTIALFGPTVLELGYRPWQSNAYVLENRNLKCRPCGKHGHKKCPIGTHECMTSISSNSVVSLVKQILNNTE